MGTVSLMCLALTALLVPTAVKPSMRVVYNGSDSAPRAFYQVQPAKDLRRGDYVVARLPASVAIFADQRGYLPRSVPVLKQIAAVTGQRVCLKQGAIYIEDVRVAEVLQADAKHRPLTAWLHCRRLLEGELFLLNRGNLASFDSRYFGPLDVSFVIGRATRW